MKKVDNLLTIADDGSENGSQVDPNEYYVGFYFDQRDFFAADLVEAELIIPRIDAADLVSITDKIAEATQTYILNYVKNRGKAEKFEKLAVSKVSKKLHKDLIALYFLDSRSGAEFSNALKYEIIFHGKKYKGFSDHATKVTGKNLCILVWEDKFDPLQAETSFHKHVCQTGLEILGELKRLEVTRKCFPKEYCGILTNGRDWVLVSCTIEGAGHGRKSWWHSEIVSTFKKTENPNDKPVADEFAIAIVAKLLLYAFDRANSILNAVKNPLPVRLSSTPEEPDNVNSDDDGGNGKGGMGGGDSGKGGMGGRDSGKGGMGGGDSGKGGMGRVVWVVEIAGRVATGVVRIGLILLRVR